MVSEQLIGIGIIVIIIGFAFVIIGGILATTNTRNKPEFAVVGFIGPFPFGAASDKNLLYFAIALTLILIVAFLLIGGRVFF